MKVSGEKTFEIEWTDQVVRSATIEAKTKKEAFEKWKKGEYQNMQEDDCQTITEDHEVLGSIGEI